MKRIFDLIVSLLVLLLSAPVTITAALLIWLGDRRSPFYIAPRAGIDGKPFDMVKLRSMTVGADRIGASSTANDDARITKIGALVRRYKLDELTQMWNVAKGDLSVVGPRPQVLSAVATYTEAERRLLSVRPGITDFASIVYSDEGTILAGSTDPDGDYDRLIRPGKTALALFYLDHRSLWVDMQICALTAVAIFSRRAALRGVHRLLRRLSAPSAVVEIVARRQVSFS